MKDSDKTAENIIVENDSLIDAADEKAIKKASDEKTVEALLNATEADVSAETDNIEKTEAEEQMTAELKKVIKENAREDERPASRNLTLTKILGGDILTTKAIRNQVWLIIIITIFTFIYVSNRYSCQKKQIEIAKLNKKVQDAKYKSLSISSELTELRRESNVLEKLKAGNDSSLKIAGQPPFIVKVDE